VSDPDGGWVTVEVPAALDGERVDRAVALLFGWSRADVQRLVAAGHVAVDGAPVAKSARLVEGQHLGVRGAPPATLPPSAEPVPVDVRYEDGDVIVVAKPAGMVVHPGAGHEHGTLVHGLLARYPELASVGDPLRPGIVHRLDKDTSGLLLVARSEPAYEGMVAALAAHEVERGYRALVWGHLDAPRGVIDAPIGRSVHRPTRMSVREAGRPARTRFEVEQVYPDPAVSLLRLRLETGRTHQIRVHLAAIGHPVVGDRTYGGARESLPLARPFLHAEHLAFVHPCTGVRLAFELPLPADLEAALAALSPPG
jgi:23S rRNA pseudouridine1911/1915/1917 synthase